jgi:hypothetical protein
MSRFVTVALASALLLASGHLSPAAAQLLGSNKPLAVPISGSVVGGGSFVGTLSIQRFEVQGSATVAVAMIAGTIVNVPGQEGTTPTGMRANISLPVTVNGTTPIAYRHQFEEARLVPVQCGGAVSIQVGAGSLVDVMGFQVVLNPAWIDVGLNTGSLIGGLVCQVLSLLGNPTMLVGVLNQLLGQLAGLSGLGGGLLL